LKKSPNSKCPKCRQKIKNCRCRTKSNKFFYVSLIIIIIWGIIYIAHNQSQVEAASEPFYQALDTLPDAKVKADYYDLLNNNQLTLGIITGEMEVPAKYDPKNKTLEISLRYFQMAKQEELWSILVHEHYHIYNDIKISPEKEKTISIEENAKIVYLDENGAKLAETSFAQKNNFLKQTHPNVCQIMEIFHVDLKTATSMATFEDLMKTDISFYQKLKPYFPKVFRESIDPKYRDKIKFN